MRKRFILLMLTVLMGLHSHAQEVSEGAQAFRYHYEEVGGMRPMSTRQGARFSNNSEVGIELEEGQWRVYGHIGEEADTVNVGPEVMAHVEQSFIALDFGILHPEFGDDEEVVAFNTDDAPHWRVRASYGTCQETDESATLGEGYVRPQWAAEAYDALIKGIQSINDYLWGLLNPELSKRRLQMR